MRFSCALHEHDKSGLLKIFLHATPTIVSKKFLLYSRCIDNKVAIQCQYFLIVNQKRLYFLVAKK